MSLPFRTARIFWLKRTVKWPAVRAAPGTAGGLPPGVMVFASSPIRQPLKILSALMFDPARRVSLHLESKRIIRDTYITAKTHATARLRQRHIPPNVMVND